MGAQLSLSQKKKSQISNLKFQAKTPTMFAKLQIVADIEI
jgi:hypothetical protein